MKSLRLLRHLRVLRVEPGDVLVYRIPDGPTYVSAEMLEELHKRLKEAFPDTPSVVLMGGDLGVARNEALQERHPAATEKVRRLNQCAKATRSRKEGSA